ncbi:NAD(P)-dependent dehydrogenase (short-subunit alcohol dehydrogenase family) [Rhodococcus sp. PvR044]|jgi:NAD(P)-dependent dehydrogenase (short-subunit alcohol dehydrogenase family)|uniref:SDR family oxidoreductase n=1 Tax=Rhodococcus TaxID=1827 RepID=UPI000BCCD5C3|nr:MULTISPECIES: SDR family oxidoreductase [Rhodococcus]MBP1161723.1 NAD(P)-dependent dehydrogenase (short-subunit alcohol dehydrogenase family) [Rhodococcus sp. PvR099]MCZ4555646.1 SDR family oxidoreductase [Rhodococcus maanshanensis]PTR38150.1 NAD(P)-dependent dehydrogenase (short-subunit alcohol dehydrogenase family) [Rhodococcus sp. OK611]SNX93082.1 NAD(P)-dependent dehydrogenase, short-chain alcohol dehydrogenase family [Rhodococcus sp. OK270]
MGVANPADFAGRAVLVTGGTKGIGRVVAETFLAAGARVLVCARTEPDALPEADGRRAEFRSVDVRDPDAVRAMVEDAHRAMGRLDVLVNNAGGSPDAGAAEVSPRFVEKIVALNLLAPFYVAQAANRLMQAQEDGGSIINIGSVSAHDPQPGTAAYSAAKGGLLVLTRALALEWAPKVRVNHITTGLIRTEAAASVYGADGGAAVTRTLPIGRMAVPADIAGACLFLGGPLSSYVNGADIAVHGGGEYPARYIATHPELG